MASYLITGASRGIGLALTEALAAKPSSEVSIVFAAYRTSTDELKQLVSKSNGRVEAVPMDVVQEDQAKKAAAQVEKALNGKGLDVLVNNAGVVPVTPGGVVGMENLEEVIRINVSSVHWVTRAFLPLLEKGDLKKIINVSSTMGSMGLARYGMHISSPGYKISKAALNMLTVQYALEFEEKDFTIAALSPGWVKTAGGGGDMAHLHVSEAVTAVVEKVLGAGKEDNGKFLDIRVPGWETSVYSGANAAW